ncbi:hypothetical protein HXZ94_15580 [Empedobacter falsenii]|uniref:hypothetical protein n=1 Tax=Empedobacter falsenii TaxID=343874 RepID=UPI002577E0C6|nr:hypothetical protein [Empedobacter falsenii]MDM1299916.1 hypothetical protein [Empedobacter falsenii]MDM1319709.1 hypothetical protein [Empedobacter falsenii]
MDQKDIQREEIKTLIEAPYEFEVEYNKKVIAQEKFFFGLIPYEKRVKKKVKEKFEIKPCTLSTLDRLCQYQIELFIDNDKLNSEADIFNETKLIAAKNSKLMANIVAVAVLGVDYSKSEFKRVSSILFDSLTPVMLFDIINEILKSQDLANFMNSTRLASIKMTISPNEVE